MRHKSIFRRLYANLHRKGFQKVHKKEYEIYPKAVKLFVEGKITIKGRKARFKR